MNDFIKDIAEHLKPLVDVVGKSGHKVKSG